MMHATTYRPTDTATERSPIMSVWLIAGIVVYLAGSVWLGCHLKRRALNHRIRQRMHDVLGDGGCWDPGVKRW
jgi:predicted membrane channel-forming protein YqfA (hemolysin III family)